MIPSIDNNINFKNKNFIRQTNNNSLSFQATPRQFTKGTKFLDKFSSDFKKLSKNFVPLVNCLGVAWKDKLLLFVCRMKFLFLKFILLSILGIILLFPYLFIFLTKKTTLGRWSFVYLLSLLTHSICNKMTT